MLELQMLVLERGDDAKVLPLFYKLRPEDLKFPINLSKWRSVWKEKANENASQWEKAVELLDKRNGEVFVEGTSETAYIKKVVKRISTIVACPVRYHVSSSIQGHQRLTEEIAKIFKHVKAKRRCEELPCMVGLHGVGGLGKTTLCKSMVNFYISKYLGRSCLIEFPTDGDKLKIAQESKRALKVLTSLSNEFLSNVADNFDQVIELMRQHVKGHDVFLAIDNVWDSSRKEAEKLLGVGFNGASKVLLTSRSEPVLLGLLPEHGSTNYSIGPLPAPELEEAYQIFQRNFKLGDLRSLVGRTQADKVLGRCRFNDVYHSLALESLARSVQRVCQLRGLENIECHLPLILKEISTMDLGTVEQVIRLNYDRLPQSKKDIFLDIVKFLPDRRGTFLRRRPTDQWLCLLYKELSPFKISELIYELALDGLIQLGSGKDGKAYKGEIGVHDLFLELAWREAKNSSRFLIEGSTKSMEEMKWEMLRRVILSGDKASHFLERLRHRECRELQLLVATDMGMGIRTPVHLDCMPALCVLILKWKSLGLRFMGDDQDDDSLSSTVQERMGIIRTRKRALVPEARVVKLEGLDQLQELQVSGSPLARRIEGLPALRSLRRLQLEELAGLKKLEGLSGLLQLEFLHVGNCKRLKKLPDLSGLPRLEKLYVGHNEAMEEVEGLSSSLKEVTLCGPALKKRLDMRGMTCLERLTMVNNVAKEVLLRGEDLSSNLKRLIFEHCDAPKHVTLDHLTLLESLRILKCELMEKLEVGCQLKTLTVALCEDLGEIGDFSALNCLQVLDIWRCPRLTKLRGLADFDSTHLKFCRFNACDSLDESTLHLLQNMPRLYQD